MTCYKCIYKTKKEIKQKMLLRVKYNYCLYFLTQKIK
nr:MAG TPA: hypothetical protein [Caudoviricetes sp.]